MIGRAKEKALEMEDKINVSFMNGFEEGFNDGKDTAKKEIFKKLKGGMGNLELYEELQKQLKEGGG